MRFRSIALLALASVITAASAQNQPDDALQALKQNMSPDQQNSLLQSILGKDNGTTQKSDNKLNMPETVQQKANQERELNGKKREEKTADGRVLRQPNEDPELRADDTVLIDLTPLEQICGNRNGLGQNANNGSNPNNSPVNSPTPSSSALSSLEALGNSTGIPGASGSPAGNTGANGNNPHTV